MYKIVLEKQVQKFLNKHKGEKIIDKFTDILNILSITPYENNLDIKILEGLPNSYRVRLGKYRFVYEIIDKNLIITFFDAGVRGDIYKKY